MSIIDDLEAAMKFYINELSRFSDESLKKKALSCIKLSDFIASKHIFQSKHLIRDKRALKFIGDLIHDISGVPTEDMWDEQQEMNEDLLRISKDEAHEIKELKKKLVIQNSAVNSLVNEFNTLEQNSVKEAIEIQVLEKFVDKDTILDIYCFRSLLIAEKARFEKEILSDISEKSKNSIPSHYLFAIEKIRKVVQEHAEKDRLFSPIFFTENEIHRMMSLQSAVTIYDDSAKMIRSILKVPLADFSDKMITFHIPNLNQKDMYRLHRLELLGVKKINRFLCSTKLHGIRFLSIDDLESCQKHEANNENNFICNKRKVIMKHTFDECSYIQNLPVAIIFEISNTEFIVDHPDASIRMTCESKAGITRKNITLDTGPTKVKVPLNCEILSDFIKISKSIFEYENITTSEKVEIIKIESRHTSLHEIASLEADFAPKKHLNKSRVSFTSPENVEDDLSIADREMRKLREHDHFGYDYASISIAVTALFLILTYAAIRIRRRFRKPNLDDFKDFQIKSSNQLSSLADFKLSTSVANTERDKNIQALIEENKKLKKSISSLEDNLAKLLAKVTKDSLTPSQG